ncbi:MAG TPA: Smr/MutS family protein, partial [Gammaproteobacteria bacterium]|nr:Smr/MutS family protein [Gammaproteobacteria bacterium]
REREAAAEARRHAEAAEGEVRELQNRLSAEREEAFGKAEAQWNEVLGAAREEVRRVIQRLKETGKTADADEALADLDARFRAQAPQEQAAEPVVEERPRVQVGDRGRLKPFRKAGEVLAVDLERGELEMDIAGKRIRGELANFERTQAAAPQPAPAAPRRPAPKRPESSQLDLRGMRREEALNAVQQFLDNAYGGGLASVTILHGKGTGVLAEAVQDTLKDDPRVADFGYARPEAGGAGVTEVTFRDGQNGG